MPGSLRIGKIAGIDIYIVSRDAIVQYLEVRRGLGLDSPKRDAQNQLRKTA